LASEVPPFTKERDMTVEELEKNFAAQPSPVVDGEFEDQIDADEQAYMDVQEALRLFKTAKTLLDYLGDGDLIRTISEKERKTINKVAEKLGTYIENVSPMYSEESEE
jgi:predicted transcriptional regulator